ncbi:hypothetical protein Hdeb2414_s0006g00201591 [Helianthus debilis subsp. tardiflorus]
MGCVGSKPEESPAVALCRQRCTFLDTAIHQRYALAEAHLAYCHSLKNVGVSLHRFFDIHSAAAVHGGDSPPSPVLNLPPQRKGEPSKPPAVPPAVHHHSHSNSGSHLHFHSDEDSDDDDDDDGPLHLHSVDGDSPPLHQHERYNNLPYNNTSHENFTTPSYPPINYPPSGYPPVNYPPSGYNYPPPAGYPQQDYPQAGYLPSSYPPAGYPPAGYPPAGYSQADYPPGGRYTMNFMRKQPTQSVVYQQRPMSPETIHYGEASSSSSYYNNGYSYQNPNSYSNNNNNYSSYGGGGNVDSKKAAVVDDESEKSSVVDLHYRSGPGVPEEEEPVEFEVHVVDKGETSRGEKPLHEFHSDSEVVKEIQIQFDRASESGNELAKILEVGKVPHNRKHAAYQVSSKMLNKFSPSLAAAAYKSSDPADVDVDLRTRSKNLSSTLHKLYIWEKKLFEEVKVEEKMRLLHDEKDMKLKRLDEKGAEPHKVDATRTLVRSLSTKIRIAIQVVDKISEQINKLRDEELWPQLNEFIQGLTRMWRSMLECHRSQCRAIGAAKRLDAIASSKHFSDDSLEATLQLEHELLNWTLRFSCWFGAQKGFVTSLNNWLLKCLLYVPEETADGPVPFSPSRIGAPTVFIICNQWAQAIDRISDKEVVESMRDFVKVVLMLWDRDKQEMRRRLALHKNMERKVKDLEREDQKIHKELQVLDKQIVLSSEKDNGLSAVYQSETSKSVSAQTNLRLVFEAMERFTAASLKACEELLQRIEEDKVSRERERVS